MGESREGLGSSFHFTVLVEAGQEERPEEFEPSESKWTGRPLRILVAEDTEVNQIILENLLTREGHTVTMVETGRQALEALAADEFDLVFDGYPHAGHGRR